MAASLARLLKAPIATVWRRSGSGRPWPIPWDALSARARPLALPRAREDPQNRPPEAVPEALGAVADGAAQALRGHARDAAPGHTIPWAGPGPTRDHAGVDDRSLHPSTGVGRDRRDGAAAGRAACLGAKQRLRRQRHPYYGYHRWLS